MIKIFVDSGSSIKQNEKELYNVEILPLRILLGDKEYQDGVDLDNQTFYDALINKKLFPKTSLPNLDQALERVNECIKEGNQVLIITVSSEISGTFSTLEKLFENNKDVKVFDSQTAVGGIKILVKEANKYLDKSLDFIVDKLSALAPKITALAVPETLDYLKKGGRLSAAGWAVGTLLRIKPVIMLKGSVKIAAKTIGIHSAMKALLNAVENCNHDYPVVPSFTYKSDNLDVLLGKTSDDLKSIMLEKDNLDHAIACHWGPNAFGFIFVEN